MEGIPPCFLDGCGCRVPSRAVCNKNLTVGAGSGGRGVPAGWKKIEGMDRLLRNPGDVCDFCRRVMGDQIGAVMAENVPRLNIADVLLQDVVRPAGRVPVAALRSLAEVLLDRISKLKKKLARAKNKM